MGKQELLKQATEKYDRIRAQAWEEYDRKRDETHARASAKSPAR